MTFDGGTELPGIHVDGEGHLRISGEEICKARGLAPTVHNIMMAEGEAIAMLEECYGRIECRPHILITDQPAARVAN